MTLINTVTLSQALKSSYRNQNDKQRQVFNSCHFRKYIKLETGSAYKINTAAQVYVKLLTTKYRKRYDTPFWLHADVNISLPSPGKL